MASFAAIDIGASGGRVMRGVVDDFRISLEPVHRFANGVVERDGHLRWDFTNLYQEVLVGLDQVGPVDSIGIDTWGVDYGLLDDDGQLIAEPIAYRDDRTEKVIDEVHSVFTPGELYAINGLQFLPFNTIYQLAVETQRAPRALLLPDLLAFWLTGEMRTETTNASTTGLLDATTRTFATEIMQRLDIPVDLFPLLQEPGEVRGHHKGIPVINVGSHDTASAVVGVPATERNFAYIASGTWSLMGVELSYSVLTEQARAANFTNEAGVDSRYRFLRNLGGLWLLQECQREWGEPDVVPLLAAAAALPSGGPTIDVDDPAFIPPDDMHSRIAVAAGRELSQSEATRCILDSLASAYGRTAEQAARLADVDIDVIHVVGGGSQNELLCQLTASATRRPVVAGPVEATALGNVMVQARAIGALPDTLEAMRGALAASVGTRRYEPR